MFLFRTCMERDYLTNINEIPMETIKSWHGTTGVDRAAYVRPKPFLVAKFRYLRKTSSYWTVWVKNERRLLSKHGSIISRHCLAEFSLRDSFFTRAFPTIPSYWLLIEVSRDCCAETPLVHVLCLCVTESSVGMLAHCIHGVCFLRGGVHPIRVVR